MLDNDQFGVVLDEAEDFDVTLRGCTFEGHEGIAFLVQDGVAPTAITFVVSRPH